MTINPTELRAWNAKNARAREEYRRVPITSRAVCERCGLVSRVRRCNRKGCGR